MYDNHKVPINPELHPIGTKILFLQDFWTEIREGVIKEWSTKQFVKIASSDGIKWYAPEDKIMILEILKR